MTNDNDVCYPCGGDLIDGQCPEGCVQPEKEECPSCGEVAVLSDAEECGIRFSEPICDECRSSIVDESRMDSFDREYARARANGWAD